MDKFTVKVITWNMGKSAGKITDWNKELEKWTIISPDTDVIFVTIQETTKSIGSDKFLHALQAKLKDYAIYFSGEGSTVPLMNFYVYGYVCVHAGIPITTPMKSDGTIESICVRKMNVCTKPTLGFGIKIYGKSLIFICSHLPVDMSDTKNGSYGLSKRVEAMQKIMSTVVKDITKKLGGADVIIWAGDMNMRFETSGIEQLNSLLTPPHVEGLKFFKEPMIEEENLSPTCRFLEYSDKQNYNSFATSRLNKEITSYDQKRKKSYCDRVIYSGELIPKEYASWPKDIPAVEYPKSIAYSDHEPVVFTAVIEKAKPRVAQKGGDSKYYNKYIKYKTKYLQLE